MTVQELINILNKIEDKSRLVYLPNGCDVKEIIDNGDDEVIVYY